MSQASQVPPGELFQKAHGWLLAAFSAAGAQLDMGTQLYATFLRAGLPYPDMIAVQKVACGPSAGYGHMVGVLRSLLPFIEQKRLGSAAEIDIDTLAMRLHDDAFANERVYFHPRVVGAWTTVGAGEPT